MSTLILVDADNIRPTWGEKGHHARGWTEGHDDPSLPVPAPRGKPANQRRAIVVIALNNRTAFAIDEHGPGSGADWLKKLARGLASWAGCGECSMEIALVPSLPQVADCALARLALESPGDSRQDVTEVWCVTADTGLRSGLGRLLEGRPQANRDLDWAFLLRCPPYNRIPASGRSNPAEWPNTATLRQLPESLGELAEWLERRLDVWSLLAPTWGRPGSVRGVARMGNLKMLREGVPIGWVAPVQDSEGVEFTPEQSAVPATIEASTERAAVGGGVRFQTIGRSARTRIPPKVVGACGSLRLKHGVRVAGDRVWLDDELVLAAGLDHEAGVVTVRFQAAGPRLVCRVMHAPRSLPELWWLREQDSRLRTRSEWSERHDGRVVTDDVVAVGRVRAGGEVHLVAPMPRDPVRSLQALAPGDIGVVEDAEGRRFAFLADDHVPANAISSAVPLVRVRNHREFHRLGHLPLLVSDRSAGARLDGGPTK